MGEVSDEHVIARDLSGAHMGMEAHLPGRHDGSEWINTWAPITMIQHKRDGSVKVRRHPDSHVDHSLEADARVSLRTTHPTASAGLAGARLAQTTDEAQEGAA